GRAGLRRVFSTPTVSIYAVPRPQPLLTGPGRPTVLALTRERLVVHVSRAGKYRVGVRWSPYWHASSGCLTHAPRGMLGLRTPGGGTGRTPVAVDAGTLLDAFTGTAPTCARGSG